MMITCPDDCPDCAPQPDSRYAMEARLALYEHLRQTQDIETSSDIAVEIDAEILLEDDGESIDYAVVAEVAEMMTAARA